MRSQGQVRFIRFSSRAQKIAAGSAVALLGAWCASVGALAVSHWSAGDEQAALEHRAAAVASAQSKVAKYRNNLHDLTDDLNRRQKFIEQMVQAHIGDLPETDGKGETGQPRAGQSPVGQSPVGQSPVGQSPVGQSQASEPGPASRSRKISAALPEADALRRIEVQQLAFVDRLTRYANARANLASAEIRKLGLNPNVMMAATRGDSHLAMGGPLIRLSTETDGTIDPRFRRMGESLARWSALQDGLEALPQVSPAHVAFVSSSYGYRSDPFTHSAAFHPGLDFPGPMGSPIYAAAQGTVTFVGQRQGYGNCIEVTHARGLMTRYGHLSGFRTHVGQKVEAGALIGAMGSTGRSTGSHLHFEVRVNGQPMNPRPFLEAARNAQQERS